MTIERAPKFAVEDLELSVATWRKLPKLPASWVIGTTNESPECDALRLSEALQALRRPGADLNSQGVVLHGRDRDLVRLGKLEGRAGPALQAAGVPFVVGPAFSTWWEWSPFECLVAMARSAHFAATLARWVPVIPSVVWRHDEDLQRWREWITATGSRAIAVDLGTLRPHEWEWGMAGVQLLGQLFDVAPHLVVNGPFTVARMTDVAGRWPGGLTFASQRPWRLAMSGRMIDTDLQPYPADGDLKDIAHANRRTFDAVARLVIYDARRVQSGTEPAKTA